MVPLAEEVSPELRSACHR